MTISQKLNKIIPIFKKYSDILSSGYEELSYVMFFLMFFGKYYYIHDNRIEFLWLDLFQIKIIPKYEAFFYFKYMLFFFVVVVTFDISLDIQVSQGICVV